MNMDNSNKILYENLEAEKAKIWRIEREMKSKPKHSDLRDTVSLLKDFGIKIEISDIPDFKSLFDLERWRSTKIKEILEKENL